ncbi:hypothetical protein J537_1571 [Acinetobacter baumannii 1437282]|nr:hypothetical protein J537_3817 [Acinetobacter baumannii 1437282]EXB26783.1 hypothetical protein J537_1571 [Acinetobacter baumannii 1437282]
MQLKLHFLYLEKSPFFHIFELNCLFLIIYSSICFIFKHLFGFFNFS